MKASLRLELVALMVLIPVAGASGDAAEADRLIKDCGVNSLYLILQRYSASVDLADLRATLPDTRPNGLSMAEIQSASERYGVSLRGKLIRLDDMPLDRPVIALLRGEGRQGHFVVLEPVGVLGKSVIVLDFPRPVQIVAYADLIKCGEWTGLVLTPMTSWERFGPWAESVVGILLISFGLAPRWMR